MFRWILLFPPLLSFSQETYSILHTEISSNGKFRIIEARRAFGNGTEQYEILLLLKTEPIREKAANVLITRTRCEYEVHWKPRGKRLKMLIYTKEYQGCHFLSKYRKPLPKVKCIYKQRKE